MAVFAGKHKVGFTPSHGARTQAGRRVLISRLIAVTRFCQVFFLVSIQRGARGARLPLDFGTSGERLGSAAGSSFSTVTSIMRTAGTVML